MYIEFVKEKHKINYSEQYKYETYNLLCNAAGGDAYKVLGLLQNAVRNAQVLVPPHEFADN